MVPVIGEPRYILWARAPPAAMRSAPRAAWNLANHPDILVGMDVLLGELEVLRVEVARGLAGEALPASEEKLDAPRAQRETPYSASASVCRSSRGPRGTGGDARASRPACAP